MPTPSIRLHPLAFAFGRAVNGLLDPVVLAIANRSRRCTKRGFLILDDDLGADTIQRIEEAFDLIRCFRPGMMAWAERRQYFLLLANPNQRTGDSAGRIILCPDNLRTQDTLVWAQFALRALLFRRLISNAGPCLSKASIIRRRMAGYKAELRFLRKVDAPSEMERQATEILNRWLALLASQDQTHAR